MHSSSRDLDGLGEETLSSQQASGNKLEGVEFAESRSFPGYNQELKNPILEFSLGRPDGQDEEHD
ncbi:hypothetical protein OIU76_023011 [Salix suchowensis]|nr:hypothetical protein OIU76_023011 [Salix suchowensis]